MNSCSRRQFIATSSLALLGATTTPMAALAETQEPIIDIHQHTYYTGRSDVDLLAHQRAMGITQTILLPAGSLYGLAANCTGNQACYDFALNHPKEFVFCANEVTDLPGARQELEKWLKKGALGIAEQKFGVDSDSPSIEMIAELAQDYRVPILMHFQHNTYNLHIDRFHKILKKFPKVNFIGHAQTWWGNIDKNHDQAKLYPIGPVTPGGITDKLLSDFPNMYGDLSAGSGLNALNRDKEFTRDFIERHQDKLLYGSDCNDSIGRGPGCQGAKTIVAVRELSKTKKIERKLLYGNAKKLFKL